MDREEKGRSGQDEEKNHQNLQLMKEGQTNLEKSTPPEQNTRLLTSVTNSPFTSSNFLIKGPGEKYLEMAG